MYEKLMAQFRKNNVTLVAVSKTKPATAIQEMYAKGQRIFGENRVQELTEKNELLPKDIQWHLIGQLQKNKVKYIAPFISCIQSVDSLALAQVIQKEAIKNERSINILLQIKIAKEDSKSGYNYDQLISELEELKMLKNLNIKGVMGIGTFTSDTTTTESEFTTLKGYYDQLKTDYFSLNDNFCEISMGMSGDYEMAIEHGSTMVRIGSLLFGAR
jgi:pyridoxal phosphate enzyme (YggS family)